MSEPELLEPSIDPKTRKISYRHLSARNEGGSKTVVALAKCTLETRHSLSVLTKS